MKKYLKRGRLIFQKLVVITSYLLGYLFKRKQRQVTWVVAGAETASMLYNLAWSIPSSISVNFSQNKYYSFSYDYSFPKIKSLRHLDSIFFTPWLLGQLAHRTEGFIYLGSYGFCDSSLDGRDWEFRFLQRLKKKIVCYFVGSEIRSFVKLDKFGEQNGIDVITTYQRYSAPNLAKADAEAQRERLGSVADQYAHHIFNPAIDQMAYIKRKTYPCQYFLKQSFFNFNTNKFLNLDKPIIVHGPSSPIIKGTPIFRAAIKQLREEGFEFEYRELIGVSHSEMLENLEQAHIVLNQLYAFVPSVFTMEALAKTCAVLTSADPDIETSLAPNSKEAWLVTPYWKVYGNLRMLLENPEIIERYAVTGHNWALENCLDKVAANKFLEMLSTPSDIEK